jgi:hypothetical protein
MNAHRKAPPLPVSLALLSVGVATAASGPPPGSSSSRTGAALDHDQPRSTRPAMRYARPHGGIPRR